MTTARLEAELYALTHRGTAGDVAFYARICRDAERVLELGCGYGRLLPVLARAGRSVTGLDRNPALLALAKQARSRLPPAQRRKVRLVSADMRSFELGSGFDCVLLPYNGLYCLLTKRDALACFRAVRAALEPGGTFAFDVWNAASFHREHTGSSADTDTEPVVTLRHARRTWDVFEHSRAGSAPQRLNVRYDYVPREGGAACRSVIAQRYYLASELTALLERAGFAVARRYGNFKGARFVARSEQLIVVARAGREAGGT